MSDNQKKKIKPQSIGRTIAFQALYQEEINPRIVEINWQDLLDDYRAETQTIVSNSENDKIVEFARKLFAGVVDNKTEIDNILDKSMNKRSLKQTAVVDRNILRVATYEICFKNTAKAIVISEAIELGKKFGDNGTRAFLNGVLDQVDKVMSTKQAAFTILPSEPSANTESTDSESN